MKVILQLTCFAFLFGIYLAGEDLYMFLPVDPPQIPQCPEFEMYQMCLKNCSNCDQRGYCPIRKCEQSGCDCIPSFVRLSPGGPCVTTSKCPIPECGENEIFRECGPVCEKCGTLNCRVLMCDHTCYCKTGFKRDANGICIPQEDCPPRPHCPRFEEVRDSGSPDEYCLHSEAEEISDETQNKTQCYCIDGYKRNAIGHCLNETYCPVIQCLGVEVYQPCPRKCNATCWSYGDPNCIEDEQCYPGCFCPEGYVMNDFRICIKPEQCPPGSNPLAMTLPPVVETTIPSSVVSGNNTSEEDFSTTPANEFSTLSSKITDKVITEGTAVEDDDESEDLPDEDVPFDEETTETTKAAASTSPAPKKRPTKRPSSSKSHASVQKTLQSTEAKASSKTEEDEDFNENF